MKYRNAFVLLLTLVLGAISLHVTWAAEPVSLTSPEVQQALAVLLPDALEKHIRILADDNMEGREAGTRGHRKAAKYMAEQFEELGLQPAGDGDSYLQTIKFRTARPVEGSLTISRDGEETSYKYNEDFAVFADFQREKSSVAAPAVFVGYGVSAPELGYDDYAGVDVKGKIAVMLMFGTPASLTDDQRAHFGGRSAKTATAAEHGAVGIVFLRTPDSRFPFQGAVRFFGRESTTWVAPNGTPSGFYPGLQAKAFLNTDATKALFAGAPQNYEETLEALAGEAPHSFPLATELRIGTTSKHRNFKSPNVAAVLPGSDPQLSKEYVIFSAHLDHTGINTRRKGDQINNGAYDNASGSGAIIEIARAFSSLPKAPRRSLLFLAVTAEEKGLLGSEYYAHHPTVPHENLVSDINLDMFLMLFPLKDVVAFGADYSTIGDAMEQAVQHVGLELSPDPMPEENLFRRSDHYSFVKQGIPSVFLITGFNSTDPEVDGGKIVKDWLSKVYHRPNDDTGQKMHLESGVKVIKANFLAGYIIANQDERPAWKPGNFFGKTYGAKN
jgi:Zn-dependent M28 family amino/carboxypeptidase